MKVTYRQAASDDLVRQFRYYLVTLGLPETVVRFREAVRHTVEFLRRHPRVGPRHYTGAQPLNNLRSWPVAGFEAIRIYYLLNQDEDTIRVVRILHGKRDVKGILKPEDLSAD
ncbi:MAG: type II toxin-antitoxin system RelE/ParE family toxin [Acidobacteriia bacterium]|nr:type II toxin-antitoxin system RelE/ParE family toxin [Terriglobia bacterium]MBV9744765.1 type II toxin-antitoxin system RelE/ParE family toxin [Terriglobia bacterium]